MLRTFLTPSKPAKPTTSNPQEQRELRLPFKIMIIFYPCDIGMWRKEFDFNPPITLLPNQKTDHKVFHDQAEFFKFLKERGVRLDDPDFPLKIEDAPTVSELRKIPGLQSVIQWSLLGWVKNDFR